jgi:hypothetical protein
MKGTLNPSPSQVPSNLEPENFDVVILGGGTGSTVAAWTFAGEGKRVGTERSFKRVLPSAARFVLEWTRAAGNLARGLRGLPELLARGVRFVSNSPGSVPSGGRLAQST